MDKPMKAITPVISIIILLLITVALAGASWTFISGYWSGMTDKQIEVVDSFCIATGEGKILIKNIGSSPITTDEITVMDKKTGTDLSDEITWSSDVAESGLVIEFTFDDQNDLGKDTSGQSNDGTLFGNPTWIPNGKVGGALDLDGAGDYIDVGNGKIIDNDTMSIVMWIKPESYYKYMLRQGSGRTADWPAGYLLGIRPSGDRRFWVHMKGIIWDQYSASNLTLSEWTHIGVTVNRSADEFKIFINGTLETSGPLASGDPSIGNNPLVFGAFRNDTAGGADFNGTMDEVKVYNRALDDAEVKALAGNSVAVPPGRTTTLTHICNVGNRCDYRLIFGSMSKTATVVC